MEALEFACFFERLQKSLKIQIDSDIVGRMYDIYEGSYDNYTLLELISLMEINKIKTDSNKVSKKSLIQQIKDQNLDLPKKYEPSAPSTNWFIAGGKKSTNYNNYICIEDHDIIIDEGSKITMTDNITYRIEHMSSFKNDEDYIHLRDLETRQTFWMYVEEFINILDTEDVALERVYYYDDEEDYLLYGTDNEQPQYYYGFEEEQYDNPPN